MEKIGLILEGGAMRGMFTAGVVDVMLEENIQVDAAIGVSAGAVFGCNYKSRQIGRVIRYNKKYCKDPRYASFRSLITTGDLYGEKFCYHDLPDRLDLFDVDTYRKNKVDFYATCTDVNTGRAVYHKCNDGGAKDIQWFRASASMPLVSRIVNVDGYSLLDGGIADSIPVKYFESLGYEKNIIVLTQPKGYVKEPNKYLPLIRVALKKHPAVVKALEKRHIMYNDTIKYIETLEREGKALVIRPSRPLNVGSVEKKPERLQAAYEEGRKVATKNVDRLKGIIENCK